MHTLLLGSCRDRNRTLEISTAPTKAKLRTTTLFTGV